MLQTITQALQDASTGFLAVPLAFALGLVSALASACCTLPAMGMLVAYSGTREVQDRRTSLTAACWFLLGTTLALIVLGLVAGLLGQAAQAFLGRYWRLAVGFSLPLSAILFGVSFGKASLGAGRADAVIRTVAGVLLVGAGLYLLATY